MKDYRQERWRFPATGSKPCASGMLGKMKEQALSVTPLGQEMLASVDRCASRELLEGGSDMQAFWAAVWPDHAQSDEATLSRRGAVQEETQETDDFRDVSKKVDRREALVTLRKAADIINATTQVWNSIRVWQLPSPSTRDP